MQKPIKITVLAIVIIVSVILFTGCSGESPAANDTTHALTNLSSTMRSNNVSSNTIPVYGHVFFEGRTTSGGPVDAVSRDGSDRVSTYTNESGAYVLNLKSDLSYNVTARYNGRQHTIWPVKGAMGCDYDINVTILPGSTISGGSAQGAGISGVYVEAMPLTGDLPVTNLTGDNGHYSLNVKPGIVYGLNLFCYDAYGDSFSSVKCYRDGSLCENVTVGQDETALVDYTIFWHHPPKSFFTTFNETVPLMTFVPSGTVPAYGRVYLDGKPLSDASVVAVSIDGKYHASAESNNLGSYTIGLMPRSLYVITAYYHKMNHSIKPAFVWEHSNYPYYAFLNGYEFDINLTTVPGTTINGVWAGDPGQNWSDVLIEAKPHTGDARVVAKPGTDGSFSLDLKPYVVYDLSFISQSSGEKNNHIRFLYHTGIQRSDYLLYPNETVLVDYDNPGW